MACTCKVGPGKFEGEPAVVFMAYQQALLGNVDTTVITASDGCLDFFKAPLNFDADQEVVKAALAYGYCAECVENYDDDRAAGMVIWEENSGFVGGRTFETTAEYDKAIADAEAEAEQDDDEQG